MPKNVIGAAQQIDPSDPEAARCSGEITPACLRELYNSSTYTPSATRNNSLGITGYLGEYANYADLQVSSSVGMRLSYLTYSRIDILPPVSPRCNRHKFHDGLDQRW